MRFDFEHAVTLILSLIASALGIATYTFSHFETQSAAATMRDGIEKRLDRIEAKLDRLFDHPSRK